MEPAKTIRTALVSKAMLGDVDAQSQLYMQYSRAMFNICTRMAGNSTDAQDILQDAFMLAFKNLSQLKDHLTFGGWLRRIVVNQCIRFSRATFSWSEWGDELNDTAIEEAGEWWQNVSLDSIHTEIKKLPEGCRQVFVLYAVEDFSHRDIAADLGISESTSKSQYHRARQLLKERITQKMLIHG